MRLLRGFSVWILAGGVMLAATDAMRAQSGQSNGQQGNGSSTTTNNKPYVPPTMPSVDASGGGYGSGGVGSGQNGGSGGLGSGSGQNGGSGGGGFGRNTPDLGTADIPQNQQQMEEQQAKSRNIERQKQLVADTQRLVTLASELQTEVDKSTKDTLSLDVIRKAEEIEKLAHNVRDRMKNAN